MKLMKREQPDISIFNIRIIFILTIIVILLISKIRNCLDNKNIIITEQLKYKQYVKS